MGIKRTQTCDNCGKERELKPTESPENGGWRELSARGDEVTFCPSCLITIVSNARQQATNRECQRLGMMTDATR